MKLDSNIKIKSFPWTLLPTLSTYTAHAIYPNIYLPRNIYENLLSKNPSHKNKAILIHEQTHIKRQKSLGWFLWVLKYCISKSFRFNEEIVAIKAAMIYMKSQKQEWDIEKTAKFLSSYLYLWCVTYAKARERLEAEWSLA